MLLLAFCSPPASWFPVTLRLESSATAVPLPGFPPPQIPEQGTSNVSPSENSHSPAQTSGLNSVLMDKKGTFAHGSPESSCRPVGSRKVSGLFRT